VETRPVFVSGARLQGAGPGANWDGRRRQRPPRLL